MQSKEENSSSIFVIIAVCSSIGGIAIRNSDTVSGFSSFWFVEPTPESSKWD